MLEIKIQKDLSKAIDQTLKQIPSYFASLINKISKDYVKKVKTQNFVNYKETNTTEPQIVTRIGGFRIKWAKSFAPSKIANRTGKLKNAIKTELKSSKNEVVVQIFGDKTKAPYFDIQISGGVIKPSKRKCVVPINKEAYNKPPRTFRNTFVKGRIIYQRVNRGIKPLYLLTNARVIKEHRFLELEDEYIQKIIEKNIARFVEKVFKTLG